MGPTNPFNAESKGAIVMAQVSRVSTKNPARQGDTASSQLQKNDGYKILDQASLVMLLRRGQDLLDRKTPEFEPEDIGYFKPPRNFSMKNDLVEGTFDVWQNVERFIDAIDIYVSFEETTRQQLVQNLHRCLLGTAASWWLCLSPEQRAILQNPENGLDTWKKLLRRKFRLPEYIIEARFRRERFTLRDVYKYRDIQMWATRVCILARDAGESEEHLSRILWDKIDSPMVDNINRPRPGDDYREFVTRLGSLMLGWHRKCIKGSWRMTVQLG